MPAHDDDPQGQGHAPPPADALKPDDEAVADVYDQVAATGSLHAAAAKLAKIAESHTGTVPAVMARRQYAWEDDPEEAEFLASQQQQQYEDEDEDEYEDGRAEIEHLQQVVDGLWIGDLVAAMDGQGLRERGISNVVSLLRPRIDFPADFAAYALEIDDAESTDILVHLPATTAWITEALDRYHAKQAEEEDKEHDLSSPKARNSDIPSDAPQTTAGGVLVHCQAGMSRSATVVAAFLIRSLGLDPVEAVSFLRERRPVVDPSETFWHQLGLYYKADGRVTLKDRSTRQWYLERTTGAVMNEGIRPSTEHMARYPATPTPSQPPTPAGMAGRRKIRCKMCRRHLAVREHMMDHILDQSPLPESRPRTPSNFALPAPLSAMSTTPGADDSALEDADHPSLPAVVRARGTSVSDVINPLTGLPGRSRRGSQASVGTATPVEGSGRARARSILGQGEALTMSRSNSSAQLPPRQILDADQLAARLPPQLAALRAGLPPSDSPSPASPGAAPPLRRLSSGIQPMLPVSGPPIITNPKCSGYFVEPLTWMEPMLDGNVSGKLFCPNEKCKAKIGTYDWAGVQCGCKEWVTPGFCLARNRVEEVGF